MLSPSSSAKARPPKKSLSLKEKRSLNFCSITFPYSRNLPDKSWDKCLSLNILIFFFSIVFSSTGIFYSSSFSYRTGSLRLSILVNSACFWRYQQWGVIEGVWILCWRSPTRQHPFFTKNTPFGSVPVGKMGSPNLNLNFSRLFAIGMSKGRLIPLNSSHDCRNKSRWLKSSVEPGLDCWLKNFLFIYKMNT